MTTPGMWRVTGQLFCPVSDCLQGILKNPQLEVNPLTYTNTCTYTHHTHTYCTCMHARTHTPHANTAHTQTQTHCAYCTHTLHAHTHCTHTHTHCTHTHCTHTHRHTPHMHTNTTHTHTVQSTSTPLGYSVWRRETVHTCASQQFTACSTGCAVGHPNFAACQRNGVCSSTLGHPAFQSNTGCDSKCNMYRRSWRHSALLFKMGPCAWLCVVGA